MKKTSLSTKINKQLSVFVAILMVIGVIYVNQILNNATSLTYESEAKALSTQMQIKQTAKLKMAQISAVSLASDIDIINSLKENNRELAIKKLNSISKTLVNETTFTSAKIHIHTKDMKSFVRSWKIDKYGDDLSTFRHTIARVNQTKHSLRAIEVGRAGLVIRGLAPIFDEYKNFIGTIEMIQGYDSIIKSSKINKSMLLVLMDEKFKRGDALNSSNKLKNYYISQKNINQAFVNDAQNIDFNTLKQNKFLVSKSYLYTYTNIKDYKGNVIGMYLMAKKIDDIDDAVNATSSLVYAMYAMIIIMIISIMIFISYILKKILLSEIKTYNDGLDRFIDFLSFKTNRYENIKVTSNDEIGQMSNRLNELAKQQNEVLQSDMKVIGEIVLVTDKVEQGIYNCRINANSFNPMVVTLKNTINNMVDTMQENMDDLTNVLKSYTQDDFRPRLNINPKLKANMLEVMNSVNTLGETLKNNAKTNLNNGDILNTNATSMENSITNVSNKANEQAASLEETAAAVEEITSITRSNANNSTQMNELSNTVKKAVVSGQELANKTALSMDEINTQVQSISDAITIIDQIAFQTNILSLNAAVEAATAGEAGKGFAVVAQEVRNLASRSAEAANEIKAIVEVASSKTNEGKDISSKMINGYKELNTHISETIELIQKVSTASKEQMIGIEQINDSITMLDKVTQENANEASSVLDMSKQLKTLADELLLDAKSKKI